MLRLLFGILLGTAALVLAGETPMPAADRAAMLAEFEAQVATLTTALAQSPGDVALHSRRGDRHLFLAHFRESVADFEKMIESGLK